MTAKKKGWGTLYFNVVIFSSVMLHGYNASQSASAVDIFTLVLFLFSFLPYLFGVLLFHCAQAGVSIGVSLALVLDGLASFDTFVKADSSTASLGLICMPFFNFVMVFCLVVLNVLCVGLWRSMARLR